MTNKEKISKLKELVKSIQKKHGDEAIMLLNEKARKKIQVIPSGSLMLDYALGIGGYPRGRIIEIYGQEASGKTTLALLAMAEVQKMGGTILFVDAEHAFNPEYARILGVDPDYEGIAIMQPDYAEQALDLVIDAIKSGAIDLVVVDSVAALVPKAELEGAIEDLQVGLLARVLSKALKTIAGTAASNKTAVIFINQVREKIGVVFGNPETTPGGRALKFYSSVRLEVRKGEAIKEGNQQIGHKIKVKVVKNKLAPPYKTAEVELIYEKGVNKIAEIFDMAVKFGIIRKSGSWFSFEGEQLGQGRLKSIEALEQNPKLLNTIEKLVKAEMNTVDDLGEPF